MLFNNCVSNVSFNTHGDNLHYAGDATIYNKTKVSEQQSCIKVVNKDLEEIVQWSKQTSLIFTTKKTKTKLFFFNITNEKFTSWIILQSII